KVILQPFQIFRIGLTSRMEFQSRPLGRNPFDEAKMLDQLPLVALFGPDFALGWRHGCNGEAAPDGQHVFRFYKRDVLDFLHEAENIAAGTAAVASKNLLFRVDEKRRRFLFMKGT